MSSTELKSKMTCRKLPNGKWKASVQVGKFKYSVEAMKQAEALQELGKVLESEKMYSYAMPPRLEPRTISVNRMDVPCNVPAYKWEGYHS